MSVPAAFALVAGAALAAFVALGARVAREPVTRLDLLAPRLFGRFTALAALFTRSGYAGFLALLALGGSAAWLAAGKLPVLPAALTALQLLSQGTALALKGRFARLRPERWLYRKEPGTSFPSGHATTAVVVYGGLAASVAASPLPPALRVAGSAFFVLWMAGICWSRVALGAHYPTDVVGGALLGVAFLGAALALCASLHLGTAYGLALEGQAGANSTRRAEQRRSAYSARIAVLRAANRRGNGSTEHVSFQ